jgi:cytoskeletal protein CcmA (bactofilin family)
MFKKEENNIVSTSKNQTPSLTMISEGTKVNGTINTENDIRIAGNTDGELNTKGKLIVTSTGVVEGNINVKDADIAGKIDGELRVSNKLTLRQSAVVVGDIYTKTLIVEEGAEMVGACRMGAEASKAQSTNTPKDTSAKSPSSKPKSLDGKDHSSKYDSKDPIKKVSKNNRKYVKA